LIRAAARCGALIAGANEDELAAITEYATCLGLLFQITDDLLDVTATAEDLGKTPGKDARASKATYPAVYGIETTRERINVVHQSSRNALTAIDCDRTLLRSLTDFILQRQA